MKEVEDHEQGRKLISAVERLLDDNENIIAMVKKITRKVDQEQPGADSDTIKEIVAQRIIERYSNWSAISGGATALPGVVPGLGSAMAIVGGTLIDIALVLKFEVEMALALFYNFGFDINQEQERQLAFLMASVKTGEAQSGKGFVEDVVKAEGEALWRNGSRQVPKLAIQVAGKLAIASAPKALMKTLPIIGIAIGTTVNKTLTARVGRSILEDIYKRMDDKQNESWEVDPNTKEKSEQFAGKGVVEEDFLASPGQEPIPESEQDSDIVDAVVDRSEQ